MARTGVTYFDVLGAAEAIKSQGREPTVDRVRDHLGTGSKSTIAPLLKQWRNAQMTTADAGGLPADLLDVVRSLYERVQTEADNQIAKARENFEKECLELQAELKDKCNIITELSTQGKELKEQIRQLTEEKSGLGKALENTRLELAKSESQRDGAVTRVNEFKEAEKELRKEFKDLREHFEHYQQHTADERQQEREQFKNSNQQLQAQVEGLVRQLANAESQAAKLFKANEHFQLTLDSLKENEQTLQLELTRKEEQLTSQNQLLENSQAQNKTANDQSNRLKEQLEDLTKQQASTDAQLNTTTQALTKAEADLEAAKSKIALLTDEHAVILQEKAVIQGQFKQLQDSI